MTIKRKVGRRTKVTKRKTVTKKRKAPAKKRSHKRKTYVLHPETGHFSVRGGDTEFIYRRASEVAEAMARLPPDIPPSEADRQEIHRALAVITDGRVGELKFKLRDPKKAKSNARETLKRYAKEVLKITATAAAQEMAKRAGGAAWSAFAEALKWFL
jgi:hypothetical protein